MGTTAGATMVHGSDEWREKLLNPVTAIKYALLEEEANGDPSCATAFLRDWSDGSVVDRLEWSEFRYWATGIHEPDGYGKEYDL